MLRALIRFLFARKNDRIFLYYQRRQLVSNIKRLVVLIVLLLIGLYFMSTYVVFPVKMKGEAMAPSIASGSYVMFERILFGIKQPFQYEAPRNFIYGGKVIRGQVVAVLAPTKHTSSFFRKLFDFPFYVGSLGLYKLDKRQYVIKRILGLPGERLSIANKTIYINGNIFVPPWQMRFRDVRVLPKGMSQRDHVKEIVIPGGHVFVMNDNWDIPTDSRTYGLVPMYRLEGGYAFELLTGGDGG